MTPSIFVVDDDRTIRSSILNRLTRNNYGVRGFDAGEAMLVTLQDEVPDLILLDWKLPGIS